MYNIVVIYGGSRLQRVNMSLMLESGGYYLIDREDDKQTWFYKLLYAHNKNVVIIDDKDLNLSMMGFWMRRTDIKGTVEFVELGSKYTLR